MVYQIWVHFIIFFRVNSYQDWINSWYAAKQTYKIALCENHKKKDGGGEKKQKKLELWIARESMTVKTRAVILLFFFFPFSLTPREYTNKIN